MSESTESSPKIKTVPSFLNNDGIDDLTPLQKSVKSSSLSLSDQIAGLNSAKNSFANLNSLGSSSNLRGATKSRSSSISLAQKRLTPQTKIAHPRVANYAFGFDIDGVIVKGPETIEEAKEALKLLDGANPYSIKVPYIFVTNGGGRSEKARAEELTKRLGVGISEDQVVQGHTPMKDLVSKFKTVLVVGGIGDACRKVAEGYGFRDVVTPIDIMKWKPSVTPYYTLSAEEEKIARPRDFSKVNIQAILVFADSRCWAADQQIILELLLSKNGVMGTVSKNFNEGPGIYFAHSDFLWSTNYGLSRYGMGALQVSIAAIYAEHCGRELTVTRFGKPQRGTFKYADKVLNLWRKRKLDEHLSQELGNLSLDEKDEDKLAPPVRPSIKSRISNSKFQMAVDSSDEDSEDEEVVVSQKTEVRDPVVNSELPPATTVYFVGDTPESDIRFANSHDTSWYSILVKTGVYQDGTEPKYKPKYTCENVLEAVKFAIEREHSMEVKEWNKTVEELKGLKSVDGEAFEGVGDFPEVKMGDRVEVDGDLETGKTVLTRETGDLER